MDTEPDGAWTTQDLSERVYPGLNRVEKKHRVSILRSVWRIVKEDPDWGVSEAETAGGSLVLINFANPQSYALGRLKADYMYRNPDPRLVNRWWHKTEAELLEQLAPGGKDHRLIEHGGAWDRHVRLHIARRDANHEEAERLERQQRADLARSLAGLG